MNKIVNGVANDFEFDMTPISAYGSINIDELKQVMERLKKIPNYDELIKDNNDKDKEIERLNNIIEELEKYLDEQMSKNVYEDEYMTCFNDKGTAYFNCFDKLKELKEGVK